MFLALAVFRGRIGDVRRAMLDGATARWFVLSAALIGGNWFTYLYAMQTDHIVEASLGYFINPLFSVLLGAVVLRERLSRAQGVAVVLAALGVAWLSRAAGGIPWIALVLAGTFGTYGLVRKQAPADALLGSAVETSVMLLPGLWFLLHLGRSGEGALGHADLRTHLLLLATGLVTALPLLWFANGARRLPLSVLGFLQYLAPTGQFLLGVFVYGEPFGTGRATAFALIWTACAIFSWDLWRRSRRAPPQGEEGRDGARSRAK